MNTCDHVQPSAYMRYFTNLFPFIKAWSTHDRFASLCPKPTFDVTCGALAGKVTRAQSQRRLDGPPQRYKFLMISSTPRLHLTVLSLISPPNAPET